MALKTWQSMAIETLRHSLVFRLRAYLLPQVPTALKRNSQVSARKLESQSVSQVGTIVNTYPNRLKDPSCNKSTRQLSVIMASYYRIALKNEVPEAQHNKALSSHKKRGKSD